MLSGNGQSRRSDPNRLLLKNIVRKVFFEDWLLKLVALAITLGLWLGVTGLTTNGTKRITVQLVPNLANNVMIIGPIAGEVEVTVSGDERKLKPFTGTNLVAVLELSDVPPGDRVISLTPESVSVPELPAGIKLSEIQPRSIKVRLETVEEVDLPVIAALDGTPATGFEVYGNALVSPPRVRIRGPISVLKTLQSASTDPIPLAGRNEDFVQRQVGIRIAAENTTVSDTVVDVSVKIGETRVERTVLVPVTGVPGKKAAVTLYGPKSVLDAIKADVLKVEMIKTDSGQETPQINLPLELQNSVEVKRTRILG
ncbi:MAG: CdaR family protein [Acidobacteriota bacterium]